MLYYNIIWGEKDQSNRFNRSFCSLPNFQIRKDRGPDCSCSCHQSLNFPVFSVAVQSSCQSFSSFETGLSNTINGGPNKYIGIPVQLQDSNIFVIGITCQFSGRCWGRQETRWDERRERKPTHLKLATTSSKPRGLSAPHKTSVQPTTSHPTFSLYANSATNQPDT